MTLIPPPFSSQHYHTQLRSPTCHIATTCMSMTKGGKWNDINSPKGPIICVKRQHHLTSLARRGAHFSASEVWLISSFLSHFVDFSKRSSNTDHNTQNWLVLRHLNREVLSQYILFWFSISQMLDKWIQYSLINHLTRFACSIRP